MNQSAGGVSGAGAAGSDAGPTGEPAKEPAQRQPDGPIERIVFLFARGLNILSAVWLAGVVLLIVYDVVGREFFASPFHGTNEIVSNSVLSILMLQLPLSILIHGSLRTTILHGLMGRFGKTIVNVVSYLLSAVLFLVIAFGSWDRMLEGWEIWEQEGSGVVNIPVYPIRTLVVVVACFGVIVSALMIYQAIFQPEKDDDHEPFEDGE